MNLQDRELGDLDRVHEGQVDLSPVSGENQIQGRKNPPRFEKDEYVVYPAHGVGRITAIEVQTVAGTSLEFFVIDFAKSKMRARVPTQKAASIGIRKLSTSAMVAQVRQTLSQTVPRARANWAKLANEYEAKIKSGDIIALAEVMRDLHRRTDKFEQSYSERQLYATALDRLSGEVALVQRTSEEKAASELESLLKARSGRAP